MRSFSKKKQKKKKHAVVTIGNTYHHLELLTQVNESGKYAIMGGDTDPLGAASGRASGVKKNLPNQMYGAACCGDFLQQGSCQNKLMLENHLVTRDLECSCYHLKG